MTADESKLHVVVVVLGDLGRSPRMQYHVLSLLTEGHSVSFVGYTGENLIPEILDQKYASQLQIVRFTAPKLKILKTYLLPIYFIWRIISLTLLLIYALFFKVSRRPSVDCLLVQNPPAVPLLAVAALYCRIFQAALVIDWHNLGYSMLAKRGFIRNLAQQYEKALAPVADGHLTVTKALKSFLLSDMNITADNISVLHDCPLGKFRLRTIKEQHRLLSRLDNTLRAACPQHWSTSFSSHQTLFTEEYDTGRYRPRRGRPALVVSATSYTRDEDIGLLVEAAKLLDQRIQQEQSRLTVLCVVTGKGALKEAYEYQISQLKLQHVAMTTLWLEPSDYPVFMACADLGVSLHTSTSGMDLPIKILDYFGCEVPVCAYQFPCLNELVQDDVNGRTFVTSEQLGQILWDLLEPLTKTPDAGNHDFGALKRYSLQVQGRLLWSENWPKNAWPVIEKAARNGRSIEKVGH